MNLFPLIYSSRPFGFDQSVLNDILSQSRRCNARDSITGALICRADVYLKFLKAPRKRSTLTYARIVCDDRHLEVNRLSYEPVRERLFPGWAMCDDPARSFMWTQAEVAQGAIANAARKQVLGILNGLQQCLPEYLLWTHWYGGQPGR